MLWNLPLPVIRTNRLQGQMYPYLLNIVCAACRSVETAKLKFHFFGAAFAVSKLKHDPPVELPHHLQMVAEP